MTSHGVAWGFLGKGFCLDLGLNLLRTFLSEPGYGGNFRRFEGWVLKNNQVFPIYSKAQLPLVCHVLPESSKEQAA